MKHFRRRSAGPLVWLLACVATLAGGCAGGASGSVVALLVLVGALVGSQRRATADPVLDRPADAPPVVYPGGAMAPPPPCDGTAVVHCQSGRQHTICVPKGKTVEAPAPYVSCGYESCAPGRDVGMCPVGETRAMIEPDEAACRKAHGSWERACVNRREAMACIPPMPTNYSGPSMNPAYVTCNGDHCAPATHPELCFAERAPEAACAGPWQKACIKGRIMEVCVPVLTMPIDTAKVRAFTDCGEGRCIIGAGASCE